MSATTLLRKATKAAVLPAGLASRRREGDVVALLYHRVGNEPSEIELDADVFDRQIAELAATGSVVSLERALEGEGGVVVTIDDGTLDFYADVVPVLERHRIPATLYLATGGVAGGSGSAATRLSWTQLAEAVSTGLVTVGSHTHSHLDLTDASEEAAEDEMRTSKELIEDHLGVACRHFAYPWSVAGPAADRAVRRVFDSAALDAWRTNRAGAFDPYRLGRVPVLRSDGMFFFRRKVRGELDSEALVYRALGRGPWGRAS